MKQRALSTQDHFCMYTCRSARLSKAINNFFHKWHFVAKKQNLKHVHEYVNYLSATLITILL